MQLVERHTIKARHRFWAECDQICFLSKNRLSRTCDDKKILLFEDGLGAGNNS